MNVVHHNDYICVCIGERKKVRHESIEIICGNGETNDRECCSLACTCRHDTDIREISALRTRIYIYIYGCSFSDTTRAGDMSPP